MTNTVKYFCSQCKKFTIIAKENAIIPSNRRHASKVHQESVGCDGLSMNGKRGYMAFNHQGKANRFIETLNSGGFKQLDCFRRYKGVSFVLTDTDIMGRRQKLEHMRNSRVKNFFVYPHAARPDLVNDIYKEWAHTTAHFVSAQGHVDVMEAFGYSRPIEVVGWSLCPIKPFTPRKEPRNVLFAPIHPRCSKVDQDVNAETFKRLEKLARSDDIILTVRFVRNLYDSGLEMVEHPNIKYTAGIMNGAYDQIDNADVVIATQTFMYLAAARGVPTIGMAVDLPVHIQMRNQQPLWARSWKNYAHIMAFPWDVLQTTSSDNLLSLLRKAVSCDEEIKEWKSRMIGSPFRRDRFLGKIEKYL